jgi:hypothetical protein
LRCPSCDNEVVETASACPRCGAPLAAPPAPAAGETVVYAFGPLGVGVSRARPGLFVVTRQNCTRIVLTDRRLLGIRQMPAFFGIRHRQETGGAPVFEVPLAEIASIERADYLLQKALWIRYRGPERLRGVGIEAGLPWGGRILELERKLVRRSAGRQRHGG